MVGIIDHGRLARRGRRKAVAQMGADVIHVSGEGNGGISPRVALGYVQVVQQSNGVCWSVTTATASRRRDSRGERFRIEDVLWPAQPGRRS